MTADPMDARTAGPAPALAPTPTLIPARRGKAVRLAAGQRVTVINTHGRQVVDTWAFNAADLGEFMSMEHSRAAIGRISPRIGDRLCTNRRRPILMLTDDRSPGIHDMLIAACDRYRYEGLGHRGHHDNCTDNLADALAALGLTAPETPCPLNLFMNIPVLEGGRIEFRAPLGEAGQSVTLRAEMDVVVVFSACPQDLVPINGADCRPTDAHFRIEA